MFRDNPDEEVNFPTGRAWATPASDRQVAIIMRTKDRPVLLPRAFTSVLSQTNRSWHLYVVNDGGDPALVDRCHRDHAVAFDGRITIIHNPVSLGMEAASNAALARAEGAFLVVHDDDDTWHPEFLNQTCAFLGDARNARFVAVAARPILIHERIEGSVVIEEKREEWNGWVPMMDMANLIARNAFPPICMLIRMDAVKEIGGYNASMPVLGDWDYNLRLLALGDIGTIEHRLAGYHQRPAADVQYGNSVTAGLDKHKVYDVLYRNSLLRTSLKDPATLGILHVLLRMMEDHRHALTRQMVEHDTLILKNMEEHKAALARQMVEHDTLILKTLNERLDKIEGALAWTSPTFARPALSDSPR